MRKPPKSAAIIGLAIAVAVMIMFFALSVEHEPSSGQMPSGARWWLGTWQSDSELMENLEVERQVRTLWLKDDPERTARLRRGIAQIILDSQLTSQLRLMPDGTCRLDATYAEFGEKKAVSRSGTWAVQGETAHITWGAQEQADDLSSHSGVHALSRDEASNRIWFSQSSSPNPGQTLREIWDIRAVFTRAD